MPPAAQGAGLDAHGAYAMLFAAQALMALALPIFLVMARRDSNRHT